MSFLPSAKSAEVVYRDPRKIEMRWRASLGMSEKGNFSTGIKFTCPRITGTSSDCVQANANSTGGNDSTGETNKRSYASALCVSNIRNSVSGASKAFNGVQTGYSASAARRGTPSSWAKSITRNCMRRSLSARGSILMDGNSSVSDILFHGNASPQRERPKRNRSASAESPPGRDALQGDC